MHWSASVGFILGAANNTENADGRWGGGERWSSAAGDAAGAHSGNESWPRSPLPSFLFSFIQLTMNFEGTKGLFVKGTACPHGAYSPGWRMLAAVPRWEFECLRPIIRWSDLCFENTSGGHVEGDLRRKKVETGVLLAKWGSSFSKEWWGVKLWQHNRACWPLTIYDYFIHSYRKYFFERQLSVLNPVKNMGFGAASWSCHWLSGQTWKVTSFLCPGLLLSKTDITIRVPTSTGCPRSHSWLSDCWNGF